MRLSKILSAITLPLLIIVLLLSFHLPAALALTPTPTSPVMPSPPIQPVANWPVFGYDVTGARYNPIESTLNSSNVSNLAQDWSFKTQASINGSSAIYNGIAYIGSWDDNLYAIDAQTGVEKWAYKTGGFIFSSPTVALNKNGVLTVYVGSSDHSIYAIDAQTGQKEWSYQTGGWVISSPVVNNGVVYVGSNDNNLYALDSQTGTQVWTPYKTGGAIYSAPAIFGDTVYFGSLDHNVYALNILTGQKRWSYQTGNWIYSSPAVANNMVYVGSYDNTLYALGAGTGTKMWSQPVGGSIYSSPAVANNIVYVGSLNHKVYAFNALGGTPIWSYTTGDAIYSSPAVANGVVYIGSNDNKLYALDAKQGTSLWSDTTGGTIVASPEVVNGILYAESSDSTVYAFHLNTGVSPTPTVTPTPISNDWPQFGYNETGIRYNPNVSTLNTATLTQKWSATNSGDGTGMPVVANGIVYSATGATLYATKETDGTQLWKYSDTDPVYAPSPVGCINGTPAVANGIVYASFIHCGGVGNNELVAVNANTGALIWSYNIVGETPTVSNGTVYVGSTDGNLYAVNATTGSLVWQHTTQGGITKAPAVANGTVYIGSDDNNLYALSTTDGTQQWSYNTGNPVSSSPTVVNGIVYAIANDPTTTTAELYAFDTNTHALLWKQNTVGGYNYSSPAVANGVVYMWSMRGDSYGGLYAFNAQSGTPVWNYTDGTTTLSYWPANWFAGTPTIANGVIYFEVGGNLKALPTPASTGVTNITPSSLIATYAIGNWQISYAALVNNDLLIASDNGTLYDFH